MIIRINNNKGQKIAECRLIRNEFDTETLLLDYSENCKNIFTEDIRLPNNNFEEYDELIEIDIKNLGE